MSSTPERLTALETNQVNFSSVFERFTENTDKNFTALTDQGSEVRDAIVKLANTNEHLEKTVMLEVELLRRVQSAQQMSIDNLFEKVGDLEVSQAEISGYKKAKDETKSFYLSNWFNIVKFIMGLSTAIGVFYYVANHVIKV